MGVSWIRAQTLTSHQRHACAHGSRILQQQWKMPLRQNEGRPAGKVRQNTKKNQNEHMRHTASRVSCSSTNCNIRSTRCHVDDFKLAGLQRNLAKSWATITKHIKLDAPTPLGDYLGCGQRDTSLTPDEAQDRLAYVSFLVTGEEPPSAPGLEAVKPKPPAAVIEALPRARCPSPAASARKRRIDSVSDTGSPSPRLGRKDDTTQPPIVHASREPRRERSRSPAGLRVRSYRYEMAGFIDLCVQRYLDVAAIPET